jgi:hypothetical protein
MMMLDLFCLMAEVLTLPFRIVFAVLGFIFSSPALFGLFFLAVLVGGVILSLPVQR